jgi:phosphoribosylcarboxyaminoimidazole (NCAIR) mutase
MLAIADPELSAKLDEFRAKQTAAVIESDRQLPRTEG